MAKLETLTDDFTSETWTVYNDIGVVSGEVEGDVPSGTSQYNDYAEETGWDLTDSYGLVELTDAGTQHSQVEIYPLALYNDDGEIFFVMNDGTLSAVVDGSPSGGSYDETEIGTYNSTTHRWFRISESGGTIDFDTSEDGTSWNNRAQLSDQDVAQTDLVADLSNGAFGTGHSGNTATWDNFNLPPASGTDQVGAFTADDEDSAAISGTAGRFGVLLAEDEDDVAITGLAARYGAFSAAEEDAAGISGVVGSVGTFDAAEGDSASIDGSVARFGAFSADDVDSVSITGDNLALGSFSADDVDTASINGVSGLVGAFSADDEDSASISGISGRFGTFSAADEDGAAVTGTFGRFGIVSISDEDDASVNAIRGTFGSFLAADEDAVAIAGVLGVLGAFLAGDTDSVSIDGESAPAIPGFPGTVTLREYMAGSLVVVELTGAIGARDYLLGSGGADTNP